MSRYAVVTPYFKEERSVLERCFNSVQGQTLGADHFVIADGHPQAWIAQTGVRHIVLDRAHGDYGNAARGLGALLAVAEDYDGIAFLDADNWLDPDHIEHCMEAAERAPGGHAHCDYVLAQMRLRRPDETVLPAPQEGGHVDTNCFFFLRGAFSTIPHWILMPKPLSSIGDRVFMRTLGTRHYRFERTTRPTVNYLCIWESVYRAINEQPPADAKPNITSDDADAWVNSLDARQVEIANRLLGFDLVRRR